MKVNYLAVHCSATPPTMDIGDEEIKQWHLERGWSDIGYHVVIRRSGYVEYGRPFDVPGAHVKGFNKNSIGICLIGGVDHLGNAQDNFTDEQYRALDRVLRALQYLFEGAIIKGHREFPNVAKECPSFDIDTWLRKHKLR